MRLLELINKLVPEKILFLGVVIGICGLFVVGLIYGDISIIVGAIMALVAMFKYRRS